MAMKNDKWKMENDLLLQSKSRHFHLYVGAVVAVGKPFQYYRHLHGLVRIEFGLTPGDHYHSSLFHRLAIVIDDGAFDFQSGDRASGKVAHRRMQGHHGI